MRAYAPVGVQEDSLDPVRPEQERPPAVLAAVIDGRRRLLVVDGRPVPVHRADRCCWAPPLPRAVPLDDAVAVRRRQRLLATDSDVTVVVSAAPVTRAAGTVLRRRRRAVGNDDDTTVAAGAVRRRLRSHASAVTC